METGLIPLAFPSRSIPPVACQLEAALDSPEIVLT